MPLSHLLYVGMGGFAGSIARYLITGLAQTSWAGSFPLGTLVVNVAGCVAIGGLSEVLESLPAAAEARAFLVVGLLGSFTTFSAFGNDTVTLLRHASAAPAAVNVLANVSLTLLGVWVGRTAVHLSSTQPGNRRLGTPLAANQPFDSPWRKSPLHSSDDASRLTALLLGQICPIFSLVAPCQARAFLPAGAFQPAGALAALGATRGFTTGC